MDARQYTRIHHRGGLMSFNKDALLHKYQDKIDHIQKLVDLEWNGWITIQELRRRVTDIVYDEEQNKK